MTIAEADSLSLKEILWQLPRDEQILCIQMGADLGLEVEMQFSMLNRSIQWKFRSAVRRIS
jgi:hypothetical protein